VKEWAWIRRRTARQKRSGKKMAARKLRERICARGGARGEGNIQKYNRGRQGYAKTAKKYNKIKILYRNGMG